MMHEVVQELLACYIIHALVVAHIVANRVQQVRFAKPRAAINQQRIELRLMFGDIRGGVVRHAVRAADNEVFKCTCEIENARALDIFLLRRRLFLGREDNLDRCRVAVAQLEKMRDSLHVFRAHPVGDEDIGRAEHGVAA